jgi:hypothetical protein
MSSGMAGGSLLFLREPETLGLVMSLLRKRLELSFRQRVIFFLPTAGCWARFGWGPTPAVFDSGHGPFPPRFEGRASCQGIFFPFTLIFGSIPLIMLRSI